MTKKNKIQKRDKLSAKEEAFCRAMALAPSVGMSQRDCYIRSYNTENMQDSTIDEKASVLARKDKIWTRINALSEQFMDFLNYDAQAHFEELEEERRKANPTLMDGKHAWKFRNPHVSLRAVELKGRMTGRYTEKHEHVGKDGQSLIPTRIEILGVPMKKQ